MEEDPYPSLCADRRDMINFIQTNQTSGGWMIDTSNIDQGDKGHKSRGGGTGDTLALGLMGRCLFEDSTCDMMEYHAASIG